MAKCLNLTWIDDVRDGILGVLGYIHTWDNEPQVTIHIDMCLVEGTLEDRGSD